jgi:hypothetical protein
VVIIPLQGNNYDQKTSCTGAYMRPETIRQLIFEWQDRVMTRQGVERHIEPRVLKSLGSRPMKIITGFRKSFLTQRIDRQVVTSGAVHRENILYLNLDIHHYSYDNRSVGINWAGGIYYACGKSSPQGTDNIAERGAPEASYPGG